MDTSKIKRIKAHLEKAESLLETYDNEDRDRILELHPYKSSLPGCLRWGIQASEELLRKYSRNRKNIRTVEEV